MAITKSAKKAIKQSLRKKGRNRIQKDSVKKILKELNILISQKKEKEAKALLPKAYKAVDKAAKNNMLKKNTAARKKSSLAKSIEKLK
jgi:small subunit ribosomal protein S20